MSNMLRVPISEVRSSAVDHILTDVGDALLILLNPCTEIASESPVKLEDADSSTPPPLEEKRRKVNQENDTKNVVYRVSSHCLAQASSHFKSIFNDIDDEISSYHAELGIRLEMSQEWDSTALLVILQIIHLKFKNIPAMISDVDFLCKTVVIADHVNCLDVLKPFAERWLSSLEGPWELKSSDIPLVDCVPDHFHVVTSVRQATIWAYVSWRLSLVESFREATMSLVYIAKKPVDYLGLPFNPRIIGMFLHICYFFSLAKIGQWLITTFLEELNDEREKKLQQFFGALEKAISNLTGIKDDKGLKKQGRLFHLGLFADIAYKDDKPKRPYDGESLKENLTNFWANALDPTMEIGTTTLSESVKYHIDIVWASLDELHYFPGLTAGDYL